jgi:hypothetical protein
MVRRPVGEEEKDLLKKSHWRKGASVVIFRIVGIPL